MHRIDENPKDKKLKIQHVGASGDMHKGDRARQEAPEYVKPTRVSKHDNSKTVKE
jgi:hypothetical protein